LIRPSSTVAVSQRIQIHITASEDNGTTSEASSTGSVDRGNEMAPLMKLDKLSNTHKGRPDIPRILADEIGASPGDVSVYGKAIR
jgi:hypothetical protein